MRTGLLANLLIDGIAPAFQLLVLAVAPLVLFTWIIHVLERLMEQRLAARFGWNSVMITGWLGTPVHELSHAVMCVVFRHNIVDMALFQPDKKNRRLGYVVHTYQKGNWFQEMGNFFIGIAPLIGGSVVLFLMLMLFFPQVAREALLNASAELPVWQQVQMSLRALTLGLFSATNVLSIRLWLFVYLVTCVGSHMAPSASDYQGATRGTVIVLAALMVASLLVAVLGPETGDLMALSQPLIVPVISAMIAVVTLCAMATTVVFLVTELSDRITGR